MVGSLGDFFVTPGLLISRQIGPHAVHTELGIATNANDLDGSKARYGIGASLRLREGISVLLELVGKSALVEQAFAVETAPFRGVATLPRTDIVDTAIGIKARFLTSGVAFVSIVLPVTRDGVRADVVPVGGLELTF